MNLIFLIYVLFQGFTENCMNITDGRKDFILPTPNRLALNTNFMPEGLKICSSHREPPTLSPPCQKLLVKALEHTKASNNISK